jgi:hypothetical protein
VPTPPVHVLSCAVFAITPVRARLSAPHAAAATVLVDLDHLVDWTAFRFLRKRHMQLIPLHSWELALLLVLSGSPRVRSLGIGLTLHFALDLVIGGYSLKRLSLIYRARHRFETDWLGDWALWPSGPTDTRPA